MAAPLFSEDFLLRLERLSLAARKAVAGQTQGERRSPRRGQSVEFADFRPYASGDDIRRIDWNAYARLEKFFIKLFVEEEDLTVHFIVDASRSMRWGSLKSWSMPCARRARWAISPCAAWTASRPSRSAPGKMAIFRRTAASARPWLISITCKILTGPANGPVEKPDPVKALRAYAAREQSPRPAAGAFGPDG